mmetsp:Transcript_18874/g.30932  ORF Transcript_18874/g.30932 Transcript_18874/m.30932 type:complete len:90 (+) Transcript_18874:1085-1354(+)
MLSMIDKDDDDWAAAPPQLKLLFPTGSSPQDDDDDDDEEEFSAPVVKPALAGIFSLPIMDDSSSRCHLLDDGIIDEADSLNDNFLLLLS